MAERYNDMLHHIDFWRFVQMAKHDSIKVPVTGHKHLGKTKIALASDWHLCDS